MASAVASDVRRAPSFSLPPQPLTTHKYEFYLCMPLACRLIFCVFTKNKEYVHVHRSMKLRKSTFVKMELRTDSSYIDFISIKAKVGRREIKILSWKAPFTGCQQYSNRTSSFPFVSSPPKEMYEILLEDRPIL